MPLDCHVSAQRISATLQITSLNLSKALIRTSYLKHLHRSTKVWHADLPSNMNN